MKVNEIFQIEFDSVLIPSSQPSWRFCFVITRIYQSTAASKLEFEDLAAVRVTIVPNCD